MQADERILVCGWNDVANTVLCKLVELRILAQLDQVTVVSESVTPELHEVRYLRGRPGRVIDEVAWESIALVLIFHEEREPRDFKIVDTRNVLIGLKVAPMLKRSGARIIVQLYDDCSADILRRRLGRQVEVIFTSRLDANLVACTIVNRGKISLLLEDLASVSENAISSFRLRDFSQQVEMTVGELRALLLERDEPIEFLGCLRPDDCLPILNPSKQEKLSAEHILYCLHRTQSDD